MNDLATTDTGHAASTGKFTIEPSLCIFLPRSLSLDADLLYKQLHFGFASDPARITSHRLELAPMLRYSFTSTSPIRPFIHAGMSFNWIISVSGSDTCADSAVDSKYYCLHGKIVTELRHLHTHGFIFGAGADFQLKALSLAPELRIIRWVDRNFGTKDSPVRSNLTQVEILLGIAF